MSDDIKKDRSPNCPKLSLSQAIELAKTLFKQAGKSKVKPVVAASALGFKGLNGSALTAIGVLNQYGLLDKDVTGGVSVSQQGIALIHPKDEDQKLDILRKSALRPKVFKELFSGGFHKCNESVLSNHLIQKHFTPDAAKKVAGVFKSNIELAKLGDVSIESLGEAIEDKPNDAEKPLFQQDHVTKSVNRTGDFLDAFLNPPSKPVSREFTIPLLSGTVILKVPYPMDLDDFEFFQETLKLWKKRLVKPEKPTIPLPANATWKGKDSDKPVKIVALMGEKGGERYFQSEDGTGIPESQLVF
ncbi:MAG TPA: hypothetical protein VN578_05430 [Candidatus Binatia bacterium]|nr:hypothetical protein [Candidatus Binatia bacterium]